MHPLLSILELWQEIFVFCLPAVDMDQYSISNEGLMEIPFLLCSVSRAWRQLALSTPRLWSHIHISVFWGKSSPSYNQVVRRLLLSAYAPLTISFSQETTSRHDRKITRSLIKLLARHIPRWEHIRFYLQSPETTSSNSLYVAEQLQSFHLTVPFCQSLDVHRDIRGVSELFSRAPQLTSVAIRWLSILDTSSLSKSFFDSIPWSNLRTLRAEWISSTKFTLDVLRQCVNLETCYLHFANPSISIQVPINILKLKALKTLELHCHAEQISVLLDYLECPALDHLGLYMTNQELDEAFTEARQCLMRLSQRSKMTLTKLVLENTGMTSDDFLACVQNSAFRKLEILTVSETWRDWSAEPYIKSEILKLMTAPRIREESETVKEDICLLPKLRHLTIRGVCVCNEDGTLADMVESRRSRIPEVQQLESLSLKLSQRGYRLNCRRLWALQEAGLILELNAFDDYWPRSRER